MVPQNLRAYLRMAVTWKTANDRYIHILIPKSSSHSGLVSIDNIQSL